MKRQLLIAVFLLLGLGVLHVAGTHRPLGPPATNDPLAWLGPLPARISEAELDRRWAWLGRKLYAELGALDVTTFVCKRPGEVGAVPLMHAVERYIDGAPGSRTDPVVMSGLYQAAGHGNWLARAQLFFVFNDAASGPARYRAIQLAEWLQRERLGHIAAAFGAALKASGYHRFGATIDGFDVHAALHHSYAAQYEVGLELSQDRDPALAAAGRRMLACARDALPAYGRLFDRHAAAEAP